MVDPRDHTVSLRPIVVDAYLKDRVIVKSGLANGDLIVSAGGQNLRPRQKVAIAGEQRQ